jgi:hypothetical protein
LFYLGVSHFLAFRETHARVKHGWSLLWAGIAKQRRLRIDNDTLLVCGLRMKHLKGHWQLILITVIVFALWGTPAVFPLKILIVFLHELSHGLAAVLTGGSIEAISLSAQEGGFAVTRGGSRFIILSAGYMGSLLLGVGLLLIALRTDADRLVLGLFGFVMLLVTALYIRDIFPLVFCTIIGVAMMATARFLTHRINDFVLRIIGLSSVIYVPYDIFSDTIARSGLRSDAYMLAEYVGGPTIFWGGLWLVLSFAVIGFCLRFAFGQNSNF